MWRRLKNLWALSDLDAGQIGYTQSMLRKFLKINKRQATVVQDNPVLND